MPSVCLKSLLLSAALALPAPWHPPDKAPETDEARRARLSVIATAIATETREPPEAWPWSRDDLAWAVLVKTWHESGRFSRAVHSGARVGDGGRARCLGQLHQTAVVNRREWLASTGVDAQSTRLCVRLVVRVLALHAGRCLLPGWKPSQWALAGVYQGYGDGRSCRPRKWAQQRAWLWWRLRKRRP